MFISFGNNNFLPEFREVDIFFTIFFVEYIKPSLTQYRVSSYVCIAPSTLQILSITEVYGDDVYHQSAADESCVRPMQRQSCPGVGGKEN